MACDAWRLQCTRLATPRARMRLIPIIPLCAFFLFDIDGTLLASGGAGKAAMEAALVSAFSVPAWQDKVPFAGRTDRAISHDLFRVHGVEDTLANWERFRADYLSHLPPCLDSHRGHVLPGIASLLEQLAQQSDVAVGLLTGNIRDGARIKLGHFDLYRHFTFGGFGDHHLDRDDVARDTVKATRDHLGVAVASESIWVIGDTPLDIRCARAIGARCAAVATGSHSVAQLEAEQPDMVFLDLTDPGRLLAI